MRFFHKRHSMPSMIVLCLAWGCNGNLPAPPDHSTGPGATIALEQANPQPDRTQPDRNGTANVSDATTATAISSEIQQRIKVFGDQIRTTAANKASEGGRPVVEDLPLPRVSDPVTPLHIVSPQFDPRFVPADAFAAGIFRPRRFFNHPVIKAAIDQLPPELLVTAKQNIPWGGPEIMDEFESLCEWVGIAPQHCDEITLLLDRSVLNYLNHKEALTAEIYGVIARNSSPIEVDASVAFLNRKFPEMKVEDVEGISLLTIEDETTGIAFVNEKTVIFGDLEFVKKMIKAKELPERQTGLLRRMEPTGNPLLVLAYDGTVVETQLQQIIDSKTHRFISAAKETRDVKELGISVDVDRADFLNLTLQFKRRDAARGRFAFFHQQWTQFKTNIPDAKAPLTFLRPDSPLQIYGIQAFTGARWDYSGDIVTFSVPQFKELDRLPERLKQELDAIKQSTDESKQ